MVKNIIFDFDGVLCESVNIKTDAFYKMYLPYGQEIAEKVKKYHIANGGMSRYEKFEYYEKEFLDQTLSNEKIQQLSTDFSTLVKEKVIAAPFVKGTLEFLQKYSKDYKCFIVSATPMDEILEIAKEKKIDTYFKEILGSPKNKIEWGKYILETYKLQADETLFIGDAINDYIAAKRNNMKFVLRKTNDNYHMFTQEIRSIQDLDNLHHLIIDL